MSLTTENMCKPVFYIFIFFAVIYITLPSNAMSQNNKPYKAEIEQNTQKDSWTFTAWFINDSSQVMSELSYRFEGLKKGNGGTSNTSQSGRFEAKPGQETKLATIRYNALTDGKIELTLEIFHHETSIVRDTLEVRPIENPVNDH